MTVRILPAPSALIRRVQTGVALSAEKWQGIKVKLLARVKHAYTLTVGDARASVVTRSNAEQCDARGLVLVTKGKRNTREHTAGALKVLRLILSEVTMQAGTFFGNLSEKTQKSEPFIMLAAAFEAAYSEKPEPSRPTPLKMLPLHNPPAIIRKPVVKKKTSVVDFECSVSRCIMDDTFLVDDDNHTHLGRIIRQKPVGQNMQRISTTLGTYMIAPDMSVIRGRHGLQSISGHKVSIVNEM